MRMTLVRCFFFFKQKTAYEMRISDWSSDVCSSDLRKPQPGKSGAAPLSEVPAKPAARPPQPPKELGGPSGPEPTRYGDWERKGICVDFLRCPAWLQAAATPPRLSGPRFSRLTQIGRASRRERVGQYVLISVVAVALKKKNQPS